MDQGRLAQDAGPRFFFDGDNLAAPGGLVGYPRFVYRRRRTIPV